MFDFNDAFDKAKSYYTQASEVVSSVYETDELWIFFGQREGPPVYISSGISVSKSNGKIEIFDLNENDNFNLLKSAKFITTEEVKL